MSQGKLSGMGHDAQINFPSPAINTKVYKINIVPRLRAVKVPGYTTQVRASVTLCRNRDLVTSYRCQNLVATGRSETLVLPCRYRVSMVLCRCRDSEPSCRCQNLVKSGGYRDSMTS